MRETRIILISAIMVLSLASILFAEEQEGLFPRIWKRVTQRGKAVEKPQLAEEAKKPEEEKKPETATEEKEEAAPPSDKKPQLKMTKSEILEIITQNLEAEVEILSSIPELKRQKSEGEKEFYTYKVDDKDIKLEDLDEEILRKVFNRVSNEAVRIRTERLNRQLQINAQIQSQMAMQAQQRMAAPPPAPPQVLRVPAPPPNPPATHPSSSNTSSGAPQIPPTPPRR